jgi:trimeric autotransporter adhesin
MRRRLLAPLWLLIPVAFSQTSPTRVAGLDPNSTSTGDGGPALEASLLYPISVAVDLSGNLYIADEGILRIRQVTPAGLISTIAGTGDFTSGPDGAPAVNSPVWPYGIAVDSHGTVYFSDSHSRVRKIAADGTLVTVAGFQGTGADGGDGGKATSARIAPWGIAVDGSGNLYIAEQNSYRIRKVTPGGIISTVAGIGQAGNQGEGGPASLAALMSPTRVAVDTAGNLYIADGQAGNRILEVNSSGILTRVAGGGATPRDEVPATSSFVSTYGGISVDAAGNI